MTPRVFLFGLFLAGCACARPRSDIPMPDGAWATNDQIAAVSSAVGDVAALATDHAIRYAVVRTTPEADPPLVTAWQLIAGTSPLWIALLLVHGPRVGRRLALETLAQMAWWRRRRGGHWERPANVVKDHDIPACNHVQVHAGGRLPWRRVAECTAVRTMAAAASWHHEGTHITDLLPKCEDHTRPAPPAATPYRG